MAAVVSHAMRRFPPSPPDVYSSYDLRVSINPPLKDSKNHFVFPPLQGEGSHQAWPELENNESALARSMRYANPWLYGSVRAPSTLLLTPAFVLCSCSDYINGTKRSGKKSSGICKKCKGSRLPISPGEAKFGTVRCYPTVNAAALTPTRAGTVRVTSSSSRPTILPSSDPYDLMRRSRLAPQEGNDCMTISLMTVSSIGFVSFLHCSVNFTIVEIDLSVKAFLLKANQRLRCRRNHSLQYYL